MVKSGKHLTKKKKRANIWPKTGESKKANTIHQQCSHKIARCSLNAYDFLYILLIIFFVLLIKSVYLDLGI